jgi:hypothetical protein
VDGFEELQRTLADVLDRNHPGSTDEHVLVALPSYSVGESLLAHYAGRLPALEHRYLLAALMLGRIPGCEIVFVSSSEPGPEVLEYYGSLIPPAQRHGLRERLRILTVPDTTPGSLASKLLAHPELLDRLRSAVRGRPAFIEPWNVTDDEVAVALRLGAPINGTSPELWSLGFKSAGRRLFAEAGVPIPAGREDVRTLDDVRSAIAELRAAQPDLDAVVVKHDNSGAGDGNVVIRLRSDGRPLPADDVERQVAELPEWYVEDLAKGAVVEEMVAGRTFRTPSCQVDLLPSGEVTVLATHEQVMGGDTGQVYTGCRFPAEPAYAARLAEHGRAVGEALARRGALGRASIDFAVASDDGLDWRVAALEVNLRKGGTTHTYSALRNLVPGTYLPEEGRWQAEDGTSRSYEATDNLLEPDLVQSSPAEVIAAVAAAGLQFDHGSGTGVVLHMLSCLGADGRLGLTAIGLSEAHAAGLFADASEVVAALAAGSRDTPAGRR